MNELPRISVNKLGEYMGATVSRRRQIIKDQKNPRAFKAAYYTPAQDALTKYLVGEWEESQLVNQLEALLRRSGDGYQGKVNCCSAGAIDAFLENYDDLGVAGEICRADCSVMTMDCLGVTVSVRPNLLIRDASSSEIVGAVKFHFSKSAPLGDEGCDYVALMMRLFLEEELGLKSINAKMCIVLDIHDGNYRRAPKAYVNRKRDIEAACDEIYARWETI
jgi:hypothetical protein